MKKRKIISILIFLVVVIIACAICFSVCPVKAISPVFREPKIPVEPALDTDRIDTTGIIETTVTAQEIYKEVVEPQVDTAVRDTEAVKLVPILNAAKCISCNICARVCPEGAIEMVEGKPVIDPEKCTGCGECILRCPVDALEFPKEE